MGSLSQMVTCFTHERFATWNTVLKEREGDNDNGPRMVRFCACVICF